MTKDVRVEGVKPKRQNTAWTCGPASLRTIFHFYGVDASENEIVGEGGIGKEGTDPQTMRWLARAYGFSFYSKRRGTFTDLEKWLERGIPILIMYQDWGPANGNNGHYAVLTGMNSTHVEIADPSNYDGGDNHSFAKTKSMSRVMFLKRWFEYETNGEYYHKWFAIIRPKKKKK